MNIYVAAVEALGKKERQDEVVRPVTEHLVSHMSANF
jgi:hypothetical protein